MKKIFTPMRLANAGVIGAVLFAATIITIGVAEDPVGQREAAVFEIAELSQAQLEQMPLAELDEMSRAADEYASNHHANAAVAKEVASRIDAAIRMQIED